MSCGTLQSGSHFLGSALAQVDCHAQSIGAYGFGALSAPGSAASSVLLAALTIFIALFGIRMMFGEAPSGRDLIGDILKIGIVLTLATSWPAWRVLAYDTVFGAPAELSASVAQSAGLPASGRALDQRLDAADASIVALTAFGTGRLTGGVVGSSDNGDTTRGIALADQTGLSWGRVAFLVGALGPLALVRIAGGILLALAPLMAFLLLFAGTRDIFMGWLRALGATALGALVLTLCYAVELALLEGWLSGVLAQRQANILVPSAPTELLVIALAFAIIAIGALGLVLRLVFFSSAGIGKIAAQFADRYIPDIRQAPATPAGTIDGESQPRTQQVADAIAQTMRREQRIGGSRMFGQSEGQPERNGAEGPIARLASTFPNDALGRSYNRHSRRHSDAASRRDQGQ